jgi:ribosomal protein L29
MSKQKIINTKKLRQMKPAELIKLLKEQQLLKSQEALLDVTKKAKNTNLLKPKKLLIARIKTILAEKRTLAKLAVIPKSGKKKKDND